MTDKKPDFEGFARHVMTDRFGGGLDGFDLQDLGVQFGLLKPVTVEKPCCEVCRCANTDAFPQVCYKITFEGE